ncbi:hypothetical protein CPB83DRAFT_813005 [Crepidotus variabilis]|uniref:Nudix hydrolase domain-containing protein n=1 Tax=Crepidotus variabilis TaxID=179855 RepID=A0A9P6EHS1_9AGAR|nr:hypothetical protein CPB83DRAFT_813005 [Crepidotus variabilis]
MLKSVFSGHGFHRERRKSMPNQQSSNATKQPDAAAATAAGTAPRRLTPKFSGPPKLSVNSTPAVSNSAWSSQDFLLGAGMVIIQPSSKKIVVLHEKELKYWFLPRGRKDVGESLEQTALREGYEESGYRVSFLPLLNPTHQPVPPNTEVLYLNTEAVFVTVTSWHPRQRRNGTVESHGGEYLTFWYAGEIPENAVPQEDTGMSDEQNYETFLLDFDEAMDRIFGAEKYVVQYVWNMFCRTEQMLKEQAEGAPSPNPFVESPDEIIPSSP